MIGIVRSKTTQNSLRLQIMIRLKQSNAGQRLTYIERRQLSVAHPVKLSD